MRADEAADEPLRLRPRRFGIGESIGELPYVLVVGDDDVANSTVGVNPRGGEVERGVKVDEFVARLAADVAEDLEDETTLDA